MILIIIWLYESIEYEIVVILIRKSENVGHKISKMFFNLINVCSLVIHSEYSINSKKIFQFYQNY